jgi:hypothetical protein
MRLSVAEEHFEFLVRVADALQAAVDLDVASAKHSPEKSCIVSPFDSISVPEQSIGAYVRRLGRKFRCGREVFAIALLYSSRAVEAGVPFRAESVHRLFLTALALATKFHEDGSPSNAMYAKWGGVSLEEFRGLEVKLLQALDYRLFVDPSTFAMCEAILLDHNSGPKVLASIVVGSSLQAAELLPSTGHSCNRRGRCHDMGRRRPWTHRRPALRRRSASFGEV